MKNIITIIIVALAFSALAQESIPEYTTIDKLYKVSPGMTEDEVTALVGIPPYDIYHDVANNCKVLVWHYRHKQHSIPSSQEHTRASLAGGKITYVNTEKVYMTFSENDKKLINYFTDQGKARSVSLIKAGRELQEICDKPENIKIKGNNNDKTIIRSLNHHRFGAIFKLGLDKNPEGNSDLLIGGQYRYIFKPFNNQKSLSYEAKLLYNLAGYEEIGDGKSAIHEDHLILSIPMYVSYNWRSWSLGAGLHLGFGNEDSGDDNANDNSDIYRGENKGYDNFMSVPIVKVGYNLYDKVNFEYNLDISGNGQGSIGVGYYWNF
jgi:hypothetical protein